jgi:hypothetical protein
VQALILVTNNVILYSGQRCLRCVSRNQNKIRFEAVSKLYLLCYTRDQVKREAKEILQREQPVDEYSVYATLESFIII